MNTNRTSRLFALAIIAAVAASVGGCPNSPNNNAGGSGGPLRKFASESELRDFLKSEAQRVYSNQRSFLGDFLSPLAPRATSGAAEDAATDGGGNSAAGESFSTTNLQELGVDESDVVKSDGTYFYIARSRTIRIVRATPADQVAEVGRVTLAGNVDSLYLDGSNLIVLTTEYGPVDSRVPMIDIAIWPPFYYGSDVVATNVSVADPANPVIGGSTKLDGSLVSSRLIAGKLILVLTYLPNFPNPTPLGTVEVDLAKTLPAQTSDGVASTIVEPTDWYRPESPDGTAMSLVITLDAADVRNKLGSTGVVGDVGTIYASTEAVYLTDDAYDAADNYRASTNIHKFPIDNAGVAQYAASGTVPGRLLNQFSLGEFENRLRVATHIDQTLSFGGGVATSSGGSTTTSSPESSDGTAQADNAPPENSNSVYVLEHAGAELNIVGKIENIAPGEKIYSARFLGDTGYLVTFVQVDPLFVLDLSTPSDPKVVGELKIPGYSDYLHPLANGRLIGVGQSTATAEWGGQIRGGVQLSLFNASNPTDPTLIQQLTIGDRGSYTDISSTHKAFSIYEHNGDTLIAIPVLLYGGGSNSNPYVPPTSYNGVVFYRVDPDAGFTEIGRIAALTNNADQYYSWTAWRRAAFIGDTGYAITPDGVAAASLANFATTHSVQILPTEDENTGAGVYIE